MNGVLALCAMAVWGWVLCGTHDADPFEVEDAHAGNAVRAGETTTTWAELSC